MAKIGVDTSGLRNSLRDINADLRNTDSELHKVNSSIKKAERAGTESSDILKQKEELLKTAVSETTEKLDKLRSVEENMKKANAANSDWEKAYEPLKKEIDETKKKLEELRAKNEQMQSDLSSGKISAEEYDQFQKELDETADALKNLGQKKKELEQQFSDGHISDEQYREYQRELANTEAQLRQYRTQLEQTHQEESNSSGSGQIVTASLKDVRAALKEVNEDIKWFTDNLGKAAKKVGEFAEAAGKYTLDVGMKFEQSMSKVKAYSGAAGEDFTALENAAKKAGAETSKSASESAEALGFMALAGWDTKEMLDGLMPILRASEAGEADLALTSDLVTDSMSAMGVATEDLIHYLDICTAAQSNSNTTLTGLLEAYIGCGGTLKNLNVPLEESATLLGLLANRGKKASEAGNNFNSILVNLMGANKNARDAMESLGVSAWDAEGNFKGVTETLKILDAALADCTEEQKALFEAKIGGKTQMDTLQALLNGLNDEYDELYITLNNCDGALESTSEIMRDNLAGSVTEMKSALEGLGDKFYEYLEEPAKKGAENVTQSIRDLTRAMSEGELAEKLEQFSDKLSDLIEKLAEFAERKGIPAVIDGLSDFIDLLSWMTDNLGTVTALIEGFGAAFITLKIGKTAADIAILVTTITSLSAAAEAGSVAAQVLGAALNAIPCVAVAAALMGVTVALSSYIKSAGEAKIAASGMKSETDKNIIKNNELTSSLSDVCGAMEKSADKIDDNCDKAHDLWEELQSLCDEQGNVTGEQERAQEIIADLNNMIDANITMVNGQIQGYTDLSATMEDYIETLRRTAKLEAMHDEYVKAVDRGEELHEKTEAAKKKASDAKSKRISAETARSRGGITDVHDLGVDTKELAQTVEWKDFAWAKKAQGKNVDLSDYDDYLEFLAWQEQTAEYEEMTARKAEEENDAVKKKYEDVYFQESSPKNNDKPDNKTHDKKDDKTIDTKSLAEEAEAEIKKLDDKLRTQQISEEDYYSELDKIISKYRDKLVDDPDSKFWDYVSKNDSYKGKKSGGNKNPGDSSGGSGGGSGSGSGTDNTSEENTRKAIADKKKELDKQKKLGQITEQEYWDALNDFYLNDNSLIHAAQAYKDLGDEIEVGLHDMDEAAVKESAQKTRQAISDKKKELEKRKKLGEISEKEYWDELYDFYLNDKTLDHNSEDYISLGDDIEIARHDMDVDGAKQEFDDLKQLYSDVEITYEEFISRYNELQKKWSENSIDISEYTSSELKKIDSEEKKRFDKKISDREEEGKKLAQERDDLEKRKKDLADSYTSGSLYSSVTEKGGKERKVFDDLSKRANEIKKYNDNIKKLSSMENVPPDLLEEIKSMNFDERTAVVEELLKMSDAGRQNYFSDYSDYKKAAAEMADYELKGEQETLDKKEELHLQSKPEEAYAAGKADAEAYMKGINEVIQKIAFPIETDIYEKIVKSPEKYTQEHTRNTASKQETASADKYISIKQPLVFNIAGAEVLKTTIRDILSGNGLIGRSNSKL